MIVNKWRHLLCVAALHFQTTLLFFSLSRSALAARTAVVCAFSSSVTTNCSRIFHSTSSTLLTLRIQIYVDGFIFFKGSRDVYAIKLFMESGCCIGAAKWLQIDIHTYARKWTIIFERARRLIGSARWREYDCDFKVLWGVTFVPTHR